jgi:acyl dehydratase
MSVVAIFRSADELRAAAGRQAGPTEWMTVEQSRIDAFAGATDDHQWIHVDPARAATGPFGSTIAHGYLTLSLVNCFLPDLLRVEGRKMGINYGTDKVRFPAAVKVGARIRGRALVLEVTDVPGGVQVVVRVTIEIEGGDRPACVADTISRFYF